MIFVCWYQIEMILKYKLKKDYAKRDVLLKIVSSTNRIKLKNRFKLFQTFQLISSSVKNKYNNRLIID